MNATKGSPHVVRALRAAIEQAMTMDAQSVIIVMLNPDGTQQPVNMSIEVDRFVVLADCLRDLSQTIRHLEADTAGEGA